MTPEERFQRIEAELERIKAELGMDQPKPPDYSPDVIRRYREINHADGFKREVKERVPVDLKIDEVTFDCGHKQEIMPCLIDAMAGGKLHCFTCEKEWLAKAAEEEKP